MEIQQLRYFVAVAETGRFGKAAERCQVAQPSLSQQIQKLEYALNQRLFDRLPRGAALTEAGRLLLPRAQSILAEIEDTQRQLSDSINPTAGPLSIGAIPTMAPYLLPEAIKQLIHHYPDCDLTAKEDLTERLVEQVAQQHLDCAIMSTPVDHPGIHMEVIGQEKLLVATPSSVKSPSDGKWSLTQLRDQPAVVVDEVHCLGRQIEAFCSYKKLAPRIVCKSAQISTALELVGLGMGYTLIPEISAAQAPKTVKVWPFSRSGPTREIAIAWPKGRTRSTLAKRFKQILCESLNQSIQIQFNSHQ